MEIKKTIIDKGRKLHLTYRDIDSEADFKDLKISGCRACCFYGDKFVMVFSPKKGFWTSPGGAVEAGESALEAVARETKEESNMKVLEQRFISLLKVEFPNETVFYTTSVCIVEPYGDFVSDPDNDITEIKMIDPKEYKDYTDKNLGEIMDRIIERMFEVRAKMSLH